MDALKKDSESNVNAFTILFIKFMAVCRSDEPLIHITQKEEGETSNPFPTPKLIIIVTVK